VERNRSGFSARLVDTSQVGGDVRYLTLSHCWGVEPFMTLTSSNIAEFRVKIPCEHPTFNQAFCDAFLVTLDLGYDYIWIDSLCIVQSSPTGSDWAKECPKVGQIYMNSDCNVSATGYRNGSDGFFNQTAKSAPVIKLSVPKIGIVYIYHDMGEWKSPESEPLMRRGWVLQEYFLDTPLYTQGFILGMLYMCIFRDLDQFNARNDFQIWKAFREADLLKIIPM
ncbi:heterokaryon incompatibility protein-domain-containing protein, partial [Hypoxylon crocopeplum]